MSVWLHTKTVGGSDSRLAGRKNPKRVYQIIVVGHCWKLKDLKKNIKYFDSNIVFLWFTAAD